MIFIVDMDSNEIKNIEVINNIKGYFNDFFTSGNRLFATKTISDENSVIDKCLVELLIKDNVITERRLDK